MIVRLLLAVVTAAFALIVPQPSQAEWLSRLVRIGEHAALKGAAKGVSALEHAAGALKALPSGTKGAALAADVSAEGHWTFMNRAGERFTAGTPDELKRAAAILGADSAGPGTLTLVVTEDAVFNGRRFLKDLPSNANLRLAVGDEAYPLVRLSAGNTARLYAELRPGLMLEASERPMFREANWQLARPLDRSRIRVLALEPGGSQTLHSAPRTDASTKQALIDAIDPQRLATSLRSLRGQTAILTGRLEHGDLHYRTASGRERTLPIADVVRASENADVNLIILQSPTPRQPGGRNWLWQRVDVDGLSDALKRPTLADFMAALGHGRSRLLVSITPAGQGRVTLRAVPEPGSTSIPVLSGAFNEIVSELAGKVITSGIEANLVEADRRRELDRRLVPGIPSGIQAGYLVCLILGLVGIGFARSWWQRIWPPEQRAGYAGVVGFLAARTVRLLAFVLIFMPLVAPVSAPLAVLRSAFDTVVGVLRIITWPFRALFVSATK